MIPMLVTIRRRRPGGRWRRLAVPVLPVLLVLSPLLLLAVLAGLVACLVFRVNPAQALAVAGRVAGALPGTLIEVDDGRTALRISVR
ncbi:hypothetical protein [Nonomuraea soli]|uniref:Uncharacterized protein n=1 Tax=Nonomuraea soli TaxID=1032476 RepID=A0A7W0HRJ6_9ACTN|nr:hypothetical protein [Nonomuraea soli]MBA2892721.1 hypothetical protein [Nonomuraea soli]